MKFIDLEHTSAADLNSIEVESCTLSKFDSTTIWNIATTVRDLVTENFPTKSVKLDIISSSGEQLFHCILGDGTNPDNDNWIRRKRNTVLKFNKSSALVAAELRGRDFTKARYYDEADYATHGGGVPIFVQNVHGIVGVLTVSGLKQHEDHSIAIEALSRNK